MAKLTKKQTQALIEENIKLINEITNGYDNLVGYDLSRTATGRYRENDNEGVCFDSADKLDLIPQLSYLYSNLKEDLKLMCNEKELTVIGYERVSAMSHFSGLRAVTMAEALFMLGLSDLDNKYVLIPVSSTALKKFITGSGRYVDAKKKQMRKEMGLKSKDDPVKHLIMNKLREHHDLDFSNDNIADAATLVVFLKKVIEVCNDCDDDIEVVLRGLESHKKDTIISFLSSWELIKDNRTPYEYGKIRKKIRLIS